jgi:hypothetical protein
MGWFGRRCARWRLPRACRLHHNKCRRQCGPIWRNTTPHIAAVDGCVCGRRYWRVCPVDVVALVIPSAHVMTTVQGVGRFANEPARLLPSDDDDLDADAQDQHYSWQEVAMVPHHFLL